MASSSAVHAHDGGVTEVATEVALTPSSMQTAVRSLNRRLPFILVGFAFFLGSAAFFWFVTSPCPSEP